MYTTVKLNQCLLQVWIHFDFKNQPNQSKPHSNNQKFYFRTVRENSDVDAGIAYATIIGATEKFMPLMGTRCTTSVRYLNDAVFGINKCKVSANSKKILNNIN